MATKTQFKSAVESLIGNEKYEVLAKNGFTTHDFCREVAQDLFVGAITSVESKGADLAIVQAVATRLWRGDGVTGLTD